MPILQRTLLFKQHKNIQEFAPAKFLVGFAATLDYVRGGDLNEYAWLAMAQAVTRVFQNQGGSVYGGTLLRSINHWNHLFEHVNGRPLSKDLDGCDLLVLDNFPTAAKLSRLSRDLIDAYQKKDLEEAFLPEELELWRTLKGLSSGRV